MKKYIKLFLKIAISGFLLFVILSHIDKNALLENFRKMNYSFVPLILLMFFLNYLLSSIRWKKLILHEKASELSVPYLTSLYFIGSFFNNFMPTSIGGDVYKVFKLGQKLNSTSEAFTATFMERFTGMLALVLISYFGLIKTLNFWISQLPPNLSQNSTFVLVFEILLFVGFWIAAGVGFLSLKFLAKKVKFLNEVYTSLLKYKDERKVLWSAILTSFLVQFVAILSHWYVLKSLGITVDFSYALFVFPMIFLAGFFIPSINGLGVQDALYIKFFTEVGVSPETALSASIIYHFFKLFVSLVGAVLYGFGKAE